MSRVVPVPLLKRFAQEVFQRLGVPEEEARICAEVLIAADLRGIASHGVSRLRYYAERIRAGRQSPRTEVEVVRETETTAVWDGRHGMGQVIAYRAMRRAMEKARRYGLGAVAVRNSTHFGIAGYYALMAAREGMMGLVVTNARPAVAPTFGVEPMLGTNPIAFAAPSDLPYPFCFDAATSITQRGKIEVAARLGKVLPAGLAIDAEGHPLTDSRRLLSALEQGEAALLPLGGAGEETAGYKGYGLAAMVEILSAALCGGAFLKDLLGKAPDGSPRPYMLGHFFLALDIAHFIPLEDSRRITGGIMRALQQARREAGQERIYVAGEKEYEAEQRLRAEGIPLDEELHRELQRLGEELGMPGYGMSFFQTSILS
ncbi:MAG: Ldh family oxidoreductase [Chloroflexia bacterium]